MVSEEEETQTQKPAHYYTRIRLARKGDKN